MCNEIPRDGFDGLFNDQTEFPIIQAKFDGLSGTTSSLMEAGDGERFGKILYDGQSEEGSELY
jgi:hypothetical protein